MAPLVVALSVLFCLSRIDNSASQSEIVTGSFTIEQPGTGNCFTLNPANHLMDEDRVVVTRCRENLPDGTLTQKFTVHAVVDNGKFSLATTDKKCFHGDSQNEFRRSKILCDKSLNHFVTERASAGRAGSDILIKQWPSDLCVSANLDGSVNLAACDPSNPRQKWKVCRSEDSEMCLRYYER